MPPTFNQTVHDRQNPQTELVHSNVGTETPYVYLHKAKRREKDRRPYYSQSKSIL